jgi:hypothetical protein
MTKVLIVALVMSLAYVPPVKALRCGHDLVPEKASFSEVRRICGSPADIEQWVEYRSVGIPSGYHDSIYVNPIIIPVAVVEWTYNFGPTRFMRVLRFEGGHLKSIRLSERGY